MSRVLGVSGHRVRGGEGFRVFTDGLPGRAWVRPRTGTFCLRCLPQTRVQGPILLYIYFLLVVLQKIIRCQHSFIIVYGSILVYGNVYTDIRYIIL